MTHSFWISFRGLIDLMLPIVKAANSKRVLSTPSTPSTPALWIEDNNGLDEALENTPLNDKKYKTLVG